MSAYAVTAIRGMAPLPTKLFQNEFGAKRHACAQIMEHIRLHWNLADPQSHTDAYSINGHIALNNIIGFSKAIAEMNGCLTNLNAAPSSKFYIRVSAHGVHADADAATPILMKGTSAATAPVKKAGAPVKAAYKATVPGATCRKCNNPNPYSYADQPDGTYLCRGCQIFYNIFTGSTP